MCSEAEESLMECAENINIAKYRMKKTIMVEKLSSLLMAYDFIRESYHISSTGSYKQKCTRCTHNDNADLCFLRLLRPPLPPPLLMRIIIMITK